MSQNYCVGVAAEKSQYFRRSFHNTVLPNIVCFQRACQRLGIEVVYERSLNFSIFS
jgi:hypothetical protein